MTGHRLGSVVRSIRVLADVRPEAEASDARLLEQFALHREEAAFDTLLRRHAGMVLGVCRRVTGHVHDAEDAFQATFLLLAQKAGTIRQRASVASWLHGVAFRVASKARTAMARRRRHERRGARPEPITAAQAACSELKAELDQALHGLPEKYRTALVLCYFEGRTLEEAARELGCPRGTVASRLAEGRERLRRRLVRRGLGLSCGALTTYLLAEGAASAAPALVGATLHAGVHVAGGSGVQAVTSAAVARLVRAGLQGGITANRKVIAVLCLAFAALMGTAALVAQQDTTAPPSPPREEVTAKPAVPDRPRTDAAGDPLPAEALNRIGTLRFRTADHVQHLAFTAGSTRLISHNPNGTGVWDAATGKELCHVAHTNIQSCDASADGKLLAVLPAWPANVISLYDLTTGKRLRQITQRDSFRLARFAPGGTALLTLDTARIKRWDPATGKLLHDDPGPANAFAPAALTSDGKVLATMSNGGIQLWDIPAARSWQVIKMNSGIQALSLSPDGKLLATLGFKVDGGQVQGGIGTFSTTPEATVVIWDAVSGKEVRRIVGPGKPAATFGDLHFLPDGKTLLTVDSEPALRTWDAVTGKELRRIPVDCYAAFGLAVSGDGKTAATAAGGLTIRLFDLQTGKDLAPPGAHQLGVGEVALSHDNRTLVTTDYRAIRIWDPVSGRLRSQLDGHRDFVHSVCLAPDGRTLYSAAEDVRVWDLVGGKEARRFTFGGRPGSLALSPDGKSLALAGDKSVRVLDAATGKQVKNLGGYQFAYGPAFLNGGKKLAVCAMDHRLDLWDLAAEKKVTSFPFPKDRGPSHGQYNLAYSTAISPDEHFIAYGSQEKYLALLELSTGREVALWDKLPDGVGPMSFSPDGRTLAWGGWTDPTVHLVEVASGKDRRRFVGHRGRIIALTFSADGGLLLSGGLDTTAVVWDVAGRRTGKEPPLSAEDLRVCWADLVDADAERAYRAVRKLANDPTRAVPFLAGRLRPAAGIADGELTRLIAELDSKDFATRTRATRDLEKLGELATTACRRALDAGPTLEVRRRLEQILEAHKRLWREPAPDLLRQLRALEVLETAATVEAVQALRRMAGGAPQSRVTLDARTSLDRLRRRAQS